MCEVPIFYQEQPRRARKPHRCCECRRTIDAGEVYLNSFGVWEGTPREYCTCAECHETREDLRADMPSGHVYDEETACALAFGNLHYELTNQIHEISL